MTDLLVPLPVALPLAAAAILLIFAHHWPQRAPDAIAVTTSLVVAVVCGLLLPRVAPAPAIYWFGGWQPRQGVSIGISFLIGQTDALIALFIALLFSASLIFARGYMPEIGTYFQVLMLLLMAGMIGFCLTHDLFNLFVWFEVMSVAAFALTAARLEASALEGALNFTVVNTIGSYMMLAGIGLIYAQLGTLDFAALAQGVAKAHGNPVLTAAFCLLVIALLTKAAIVPFQFWLSDAHAVAPSPVSVIFSGAMVSVALYGAAKLYHQVFAGDPPVDFAMHHLMLGMGAVSAIIGGLMCLWQRHLKRLLAFSTIAHLGIMLVGISLPSAAGTVGMIVYLLGHGLVKASAFMIAGILLATYGGIDELGLRGYGRAIWPAGVAMALAGLLLAGTPIGLLGEGAALIGSAADSPGDVWAFAAVTFGAGLTGAAVLRATGRIFLGLGPVPGEEEFEPTEHESESQRPFWLMFIPCATLLLASLVNGTIVADFVHRAAAAFLHPDNAAILRGAATLAGPARLPPLPHDRLAWVPWLGVVLALSLAAWDLSRRWLPRRLRGLARGTVAPLRFVLSHLHDGIIGDYVAWMLAGLAIMAVVLALA